MSREWLLTEDAQRDLMDIYTGIVILITETTPEVDLQRPSPLKLKVAE